MTTIAKAKFTNAAIGADAKILEEIHQEGKNIVIFQRDIEALKDNLAAISDRPIDCRLSGTKAEIFTALKSYFDRELPEATLLLEDITSLVDHFEQVTKSPSFRLLLATIDSNMCRKFHTDINDIRMLCTYFGQGTLWLPDEAIEGTPKPGNKDIVINENLIQQTAAGDLTLLKGALYPKASPIMHRSPSIEESGEQRLLLRVDTNSMSGMF